MSYTFYNKLSSGVLGAKTDMLKQSAYDVSVNGMGIRVEISTVLSAAIRNI